MPLGFVVQMEMGGRGGRARSCSPKMHIVFTWELRSVFCSLSMAHLYRIQVAQLLSTTLLPRHLTRHRHSGFEESEVGQYGADF